MRAAAWLLTISVAAATACSFSVDYAGTGYTCGEGGACPTGQTCDVASQRCVPAAGAADADVHGSPDAAVPTADWWDTRFPNRRRVAVHNGSGAPLSPGQPVALRLDLDDYAAAGGDYAGARVVYHGRGQPLELPRVIDRLAGGDEWLWFALDKTVGDGATDEGYYLYYDAGVTVGLAPDDPAAIFIAVIEFENGDDGLVEYLLTPSYAAGAVVLDSGNGLALPGALPAGVAVDVELDLPLVPQGVLAGLIDGNLTGNSLAVWEGQSLSMRAEVAHEGVSISSGSVSPGTAPHLYSIERRALFCGFRFDAETRFTLNTPGGLDGASLLSFVDNAAQSPLTVGLLRLRPLAGAADPELSLGDEESAPSGP